MRLLPCSWRYNLIKPELGDKTHYGFIAQDLLRDFGDKYGFVNTSGEYLTVNYIEFIAPLVKVVQEQDIKIQQLEQTVKELHEHYIRTGSSRGPRVPLGSNECDKELAGQPGESRREDAEIVVRDVQADQ